MNEGGFGSSWVTRMDVPEKISSVEKDPQSTAQDARTQDLGAEIAMTTIVSGVLAELGKHTLHYYIAGDKTEGMLLP